MNISLKTLFLLLALGLVLNISYAEPLDTNLSRDKMALGETVTLSFTLNNTRTNASPDFSPLKKDFRIVNTNYSTAINVINGVTQTQTIWQVTLEPKMAGELAIPEINFGNMKSSARKLLVQEAAPTTQTDTQNAATFVRAEISTKTPYVQSQVLYTFKLFYRIQLENPIIEPPLIANGVLEQVGEDKVYQADLHGEQYVVFEKTLAIFPQKAGKLVIPPTHFRAVQFDINPNLMNDPFSIATSKLINLATPSFSLDVQKAPANFQGKIWLPAKQLSLTEKWSANPNQWEANNPITRTITIEALGLRADQIPDVVIEPLSGVNIYPDPPHRSNRVQDGSILGVWQQKITYIPTLAKSINIPALKLNWWNTQTNTNATAQLAALTANVKGPSQIAPIAMPQQSIKPIALPQPTQQITTSINQPAPFYLSIWFWISIVLLMGWLITLGWIGKKTLAKTAKSNPVIKPKPLSDKTFAQACEGGDAMSAKKLILAWAATQWQDAPQSLGKLAERVNDDNFKKALENLEQALYADGMISWNGGALLAAYKEVQKIKMHKQQKSQITNQKPSDPLPPLYPY